RWTGMRTPPSPPTPRIPRPTRARDTCWPRSTSRTRVPAARSRPRTSTSASSRRPGPAATWTSTSRPPPRSGTSAPSPTVTGRPRSSPSSWPRGSGAPPCSPSRRSTASRCTSRSAERAARRRRGPSSVQVHDLELEHALGPGDRGRRIPRLALLGPDPEALLVRPAGQDEVALLARDRTQQLEALEAGRPVHGVLPGGEALLELGRLPAGDGEAVDLHDGHRVLLVVGCGAGGPAARCGQYRRAARRRAGQRDRGGGRRSWYGGAGRAADGRGPA